MQIIEIEPDKLNEITGPINNGKTCFLLLYADWCGHCQEFKPVWKNIHSEMKNELGGLNTIMAQIEEKELNKINNKPKFMKDILGFPTIRIVDTNGFNDYEGERKKEPIKKRMRQKKKGGRKTRRGRRRRLRKTKRRYRKTQFM
jgi:thiol-disulfide isomerase/thioredoxin